MRNKLALFLSLVFIIVLGIFSPAFAQSKNFTAEELSQFDGKNGHKAYYAYEGKVYDVSNSKLWEQGQHYGLQAGQDLTGKMTGAPHGTEVFAGFEVVGTYGVAATSESATPLATVMPAATSTIQTQSKTASPWYANRIRIMGLSILGWTGIFLGILFVLTFSTCFAMPWGKLPLPWRGGRIGKDPLDAVPHRMTWSSIHKNFVWWLVVIAIIHGVLGFLQFFGIYL